MRVLTLLAVSLLLASPVRAQLPVADSAADAFPAPAAAAGQAGESGGQEQQDGFVALLRGSRLYEQRRYGAAIRPLQRAFAASPSEDAASMLYHALLWTGQSLEAQAFRNAHRRFTYALPPSRFRLEYGFAEGGVKGLSKGSDARLVYGGAGAGVRFAGPLRLRQHFYFWQQPGEPRSYHQFESRTSLDGYLGRGWLLLPAVHCIYQPYRAYSESTRNVSYTADYEDGGDVYRYVTAAQQTTTTVTTGHNVFAGLSLGVQKRLGAFELSLTPGLQYLPGRYHYQYRYESQGRTDSSRNGFPLGSRPFYDGGTGSGDSVYQRWIAQIGAGLGWRPPLRGAPLYLRAAAYGLRSSTRYAVGAADFYSLVQLRPFLWLHLSALFKSGLPLLTGSEGVYLNYDNRIGKRFGGTLQFWPLRHFSPALTYQFEELQGTDRLLPYHSVYLTFSYQP